MQRLAATIRQRRDSLAREYSQQLRAIGNYASLAEQTTLDVARYDLDLIATCLEAGNEAPFIQFTETRVGKQTEQGFGLDSLQKALTALEETLLPQVTDVESAKFLWHMLSKAREVVSRQFPEALRASEAKFRALAENLAVGVFIHQDGVVRYVGGEAARLIGYDQPDQLVERSIMDFVHDGDRARVADIARRRAAGEAVPNQYEVRLLKKDGSFIYAWLYNSLVEYEGRAATQVVFVDITEREQTEETLKESEEKYRTILENIEDGYYEVDLAGNLTFFNDSLCRLYGYSEDELMGMSYRQYTDDQTAQAMYQIYNTVYQTGKPVTTFDWEAIRKDGTRRFIQVSVSLMHGPTGEPVGFRGIVRDSTERKRAEEEIRRLADFQTAILDNAGYAVIATDPEGVIVTFNPTAERMLGYGAQEFIGKVTPSVFHDPEQVAARARLFSAELGITLEPGFEVFVAKARHNLPNEYEWTYIRKDGSRFPVLLAVTALRNPQGDIIGFLGIANDITERKQLEQRIQESLVRRAYQVQTSTEIAQEIAAAPALDELFRRVVTLIKERFGYYHAQIFRYEPTVNAVVLVTGYGEAGRKMLAASHHLAMGRGIVGTAAATGRAILATDVTQDKNWRPNPNLPETQGELAVPIQWRGQVLGILDVQSERAGALTQDDQLLLESLCGQIAIAITDTRLRQEMQDRLNELNAMYRAVSREGWQAFRQMAKLPTGYLFDRTAIRPAEDLWMPEIGQAVEQNALVPPYSSAAADAGRGGGVAAAPLSVRGEIIGAMGVYDDPRHPLSPEDLALVEQVSEQVALALESARLFEETRTRAEETAALNELSRALTTRLSVDQVLEEVHRDVSRLLDTTNFYIGLYNPEKNEVTFPINVSESVMDRQIAALPADRGLTGYVIRNRATLFIKEDVAGWYEKTGTELVGEPAQCWLGVPLMIGDQVLGVMSVQSYATPNAFDDHDRDLLEAIASQTAIAVQNARLFEETHARAEREQLVRAITDKIRRGTDTEAILRITIHELGQVLGASKSAVRLDTQAQLISPRQGRAIESKDINA